MESGITRQEVDQKWVVLLCVGVGAFMAALDGSVVNVILPVISRDFNTDVATIEWVVTVYLLVVSGLLLSFGRIGDLKSHKQIYLLGFVVFIIGSALSGLAPNVTALIAFRAVQALGAAMLYANSPAILTGNFPASQRGQALGMQATMTYLGLTAGPSLGGWLTNLFSWHAVFLINIPIGLLALFLSARFIPADQPRASGARFDWVGAATFTVGLVALLLALNQGHAWGWNSAIIIGLLALSGVLLSVFLWLEKRLRDPMVDLTLFSNRVFLASTVSAIINYLCVYTIVFLLPFYLIQGRGLNTASAGLILTAQPVVMVIAAPLSGIVSDRIGSRLPGTLGMLILAIGLFFLSRLSNTSPLADVAIGLAVVGLGVGLFTSPNNSALMGSAPRHRQGIASGILAMARNVGMVLGVALAGAIFTTILSFAPAEGAQANLFQAVSVGFTVSSGIAVAGIFTSALRGS